MDQQKLIEKLTEIGGIEENMITRKRKIMDEIMKEMSKKDEEIVKLKMKMAKMEVYIKELKFSIRRRQMPMELLSELFASMPLENAFALLAKMPNGLLDRNVQKMFNGIKETMKNNKLNEENCGPNLTISEGGLVAKHSGPNEYNSVRANLPIPALALNAINKPAILFYFEMEILAIIGHGGICIGFCDQQFTLQGKWLGQENTNSIGIRSKGGIWIDGSWTKIGNDSGYFKKGDFVGLGIIHRSNSKMECFVTWNGKLLGKTEFLSKFSTMQLFPAVDLICVGDSVRANFVKEEWKFKEFGRVLE